MKTRKALESRSEYVRGEKKMVAMRLPVRLWGELEKVSKQLGRTRTDIVTTVLDHYVQQAKAKRR